MHRRLLRSSLAPLVLAFFSATAFADRVYVEPATGPSVPQSELATASELIRSSAAQAGQEIVTEPANAQIVLKPHLVKLGAAYILSVDRVQDGKVTATSELKAERIEELDKVADRVTRSALQGANAKSDARVGDVTEQEAHEGTERKPARKGVMLGFGPGALSNLNGSGVAYCFTGAYVWDVNAAMVKIQGDFNAKGDALLGDFGLAGDYFLTNRDIAPYLGALVGFGVAKVDGGGFFDGQTTAGFALGGSAGVQFLRTSAIHLELGVQFTSVLSSNAYGLPSLWAGHIGFYF